MTLFPRAIEPVLRRAVSEFPAVVLTGPRQSGKTTVLMEVFGDRFGYLLLDLPDVKAAATEDPRSLLDAHPPPVILDEVQNAPGLLPYIKARIDEDRSRPGQYVLTGSQNLLLLQQITESLAGRAAMLRLLPASRREAAGDADAPLPWEEGSRPPPGGAPDPDRLWTEFLRGGYPEVVGDPGRDLALWHASYVQTYLERDVRTLRQVGDLTQFQSFLRALAARSGQLLNMSDLARDLGTAVNTIKAWISVLEASFQILVLRPWVANVGKRLVKTPKVYFTDVGTLCYLTGLRGSEHAARGPMGGAILETAVVSEVSRRLSHRGLDPQLHFWRTSRGEEVDLLVGVEGRWVPIEVKLSGTPRPAMGSAIQALRRDLGDAVLPGWVVHPGRVRLPLGPDVTALPFAEL